MTDPIRDLKIAKGLPLAKRLKKSERSDKTVLAEMGLAALLPDASEPAPEAERRKPSEKRRRLPPAFVEGRRRSIERRRANPPPPHTRPRAHILRLMEPGRFYVVNDIIRACPQLSQDAVKIYMRQRLLQMGLVERVPAPAGMKHRGPLDHGSPHKDPIRWLYRLTAMGIAEAQAVAEGDAAAARG